MILDAVLSTKPPLVQRACGVPRWILPALCSVAFVPIFSALIVAASLPRIAVEFGIAENKSGLLLAFNLFGLAVGFLVGGLVQVRCSAARATAVGMGLLAALAVLTSQAQGFQSFLLLRLLQAVAAGVSLCAIGPIVRMSWEGDPVAATRANVAIAASTGLGPLLGLPTGALLDAYADWRLSMLVVAALAACVAILVHVSLPSQRPIGIEAVASPQAAPIHSTVSAFALVGALSLAVVYAFMTVSPAILLSNWQIPKQNFAVLVTLPPAGMLLVGTLARAALARGAISLSLMGPMAAFAQVLAGIGFIGVAFSDDAQVQLFVACGVACAAANALLLAYSITRALQRLPQHYLGRGSALVGSLHMLGAAMGSGVVSILARDSRLALCCVVLIASTANLLLAWRLRPEGAT